MKKKKKGCLLSVSEVSRFPNFTKILVLQLVVLPNRTLRTKAILFLNGLFGFPFGAKSYTAQLRFGESWAAWANALFRVLSRIWNHHTQFPITPPFST
jgi:hypothetical protein